MSGEKPKQLLAMKCDLCKYCGAALYAALALMAASCSMSDDISADCGRTDDAKQVYVKLRVSVPSQAPVSRAGDPTGGEAGDSTEVGQTYENSINSVLVFFYRADDNNNINAEASTPIDEYAHLTTVTEEKENGSWVTNPVQVSLDLNTPYNVIVVANPGDTSWAGTEEGRTLGGVRDHIYKQAWKESGDGYTDFVMSSEDGTETITVTDKNTSETNPATTNVDVERLAARVDYQTNQKNNYDCTDGIGSVTITGAAIINQFTAGTYLIKRVTQGSITDNVTYLGDEEPAGADGGVATNYVIDPWMAVKTAANAMLSDGNTPFEVNGTKVNAAGLYEQETYYPTIPDGANPEAWADYCKKGTPMEDAGAGWTRVGYTLENTTLAENTSTAYNTGIVFKAQFTPAGVADYTYTPGNTFFRYDNTIYTTLTGMMASLNSQQNFAQYVSNAIRGFKSWSDVTEFADGLTDPTGYADYLKGLAGAGADFSIDGIGWTEYMRNVLGVDESSAENDPQINQGGINTRDVLFTNSKERLRTYYKGQCYYIWWLRHSNNGDDTTNGIMEYAVVRNNIYKVSVSSVSSIGGDIPGAEELRAHVYVNDWVSLEEETLPM